VERYLADLRNQSPRTSGMDSIAIEAAFACCDRGPQLYKDVFHGKGA